MMPNEALDGVSVEPGKFKWKLTFQPWATGMELQYTYVYIYIYVNGNYNIL